MNPHSTFNSRSLIAAISAMALLPTAVQAASILVPNGSFEDPDRTGSLDAYSTGNPTGWTFTSGVNGGVEESRDNRFGVSGSEGSRLDALGGAGDQVGFINIGNSGTGTATTGVLATVVADTTYTMTIALAQRAAGDRLPDGNFGLWVAGAEVGTFTSYLSASMATGFTDLTYVWTAPSAGDPLVGGDIQIRMNFSYAAAGGWQQAQFDNVRLSAVPEPTSALLGGLGLLALLRRRRA